MNGRQVQAVEEARFDEVDWSWERHAVCIVDALLAGGLDSSAMIGLRALVRARKDLVKHRIALANQLRANVLAALPGAVGLFAEIDSPISLTFLTRLPSQLVAALRELRGRTHRRHRRGHRRDPRPAPRRRCLHQPAPRRHQPRRPAAGRHRRLPSLFPRRCRARPPPPESRPPPGPAARDTTWHSGTRATRSCAKHPSTSPPTAAKPVLGPPRSTNEPVTAVPGIQGSCTPGESPPGPQECLPLPTAVLDGDWPCRRPRPSAARGRRRQRSPRTRVLSVRRQPGSAGRSPGSALSSDGAVGRGSIGQGERQDEGQRSQVAGVHVLGDEPDGRQHRAPHRERRHP